MKVTIVNIMFLFFSVWAVAQEDVEFKKRNFSDRKDEFKKAEKALDKGNDLFEAGEHQYRNALPHLKKANDFNPDNALLNYRIGVCYINTMYKTKSVKYFKKAYQLNPEISEDIYYQLAKSHHLDEQWDEAIKWYNKYRSYLVEKRRKSDMEEYLQGIMPKRVKECESGKKLSSSPERVFIENIGSTINTKYPEYGPVITADNSVMYFTSRRPGSTGFEDVSEEDLIRKFGVVDYYEDIYRTEFKNGKWTDPVNLREPINTDGQDATVGISADGQHIWLYRATSRSGGLYDAWLEGDEWTKPKELGKNINSKHHESSCAYSMDKKTLYFVSNRPDGNLGGPTPLEERGQHTKDIFYSEWDERKNKWEEAKNMGPVLNTKYNERGVFMHPDGKTMFFSSEGHNSMGGYDLFKTVLQEDGSWSKPENLGYPVNGPDHDVFMVISADGRKGYYSSEHPDGYGRQDIYTITFLGAEKEVVMMSEDNLLAGSLPVQEDISAPEVEVVTAQSSILKGKVLDAITQEPVKASIELIDNEKNRVVATFSSNKNTGSFLVSLPSGKNYGIAVSHPDYLFHSENFVIPENSAFREIYKEVHLKSVSVGSKIVLRNIFFDFDKASLREESFPELDRLVDLLNEVDDIKIEIGGHTDSRGSASYNQQLSERRAKSVVDYLVDKGINPKRLKHVGYGQTSPIADNDTEEGRQQNRRTEFEIIE